MDPSCSLYIVLSLAISMIVVYVCFPFLHGLCIGNQQVNSCSEEADSPEGCPSSDTFYNRAAQNAIASHDL